MALKITTEPRENRQLAVTIEVPQERVESELRKAARKVAGQYRIPGFRPGKAPYNVIVQQFGLANLYSEFVDNLGQEVYKEALKEQEIEPYAIASLEDIQLEPLTYRLVVPLEPVVELGDYRSLRLEQEKSEVGDEQLDARLEQLREQYASWQEMERPTAYGDMLTIDVRSVIANEDGGETVVLDETDWDVTPDEENPMDPPGFDAALLGMSTGEEKEFELSWPAESQSIHAGKTATFKVKVKGIQAYDKPELDDAFAQMVGPEIETLEDLKTRIRESLSEDEKGRAENAYLEKALDAVVEISTLDYPPAVVEDQLDAMMNELEQRLRSFGIEDLDTYFQQVGQDKDEYREGLRERAELEAKRNLVLSELVKAEGVRVSDAEIRARAEEIMGQAPETDADEHSRMVDSLVSAAHGVLLNSLLRTKSLDRLLAIVRGEEVPPPGMADEEEPVAESEPETEEDTDAADVEEEGSEAAGAPDSVDDDDGDDDDDDDDGGDADDDDDDDDTGKE